MRFSTDDGRFGLIVTKLAGWHMFRFQMIIDGRVIGDADECIIGSAMARLTNLGQLEDSRFAALSTDPAAVLSVLETDEVLHDIAVVSIAESLDQWLICSYVCRDTATMMAQELRGDDLVGPILVSTVPVADYSTVMDAVRTFWLKTRELD